MNGLAWKQIIIGLVSGGVLSGIGSWMFYNQKLSRERRSGGKKLVADKMLTALEKTRDFERQIRTIESVWPDDKDEENIIDGPVYPEFMTSESTFTEMMDSLLSLIDENEGNLDRKSVAYLMAFQRYLFALMATDHLGEGVDDTFYRGSGAVHKPEIDKWQRDFDRHLVKRINKHPWKLESLSGRGWDLLRTRIVNKYVTKYVKKGTLDISNSPFA